MMALKKWLVKHTRACKPSSLRERFRDCDWHRMLVSFWGSLAFIGLGASLLVFAPTLLDVARHLSVGVGTVSLMFACRAVGAVTGSVSSGIILDRLSGFSYTTISIILISSIATTVVLPLSIHIGMLAVLMFFNGVATGSLDNGVQVVLLRLWGDKSGPCMQVVHFCFAFGAFIAPLIAKPFISDDVQDISNTTCELAYNDSAFIMHPPDTKNDSDCFAASTSDMNCSFPLNATDKPPPESDSNFAWAFWITSSLLVLPLFAFIYFSLKHELVKKCCSRRKSLDLVNKEEEGDSKESDEKPRQKQSIGYRATILTLLFFFMLIYVGLEVAFGSLIFTVAVTGELCFSKSSAALLQSVFWGTFAFMRFFSVSLALLEVRPSVMLIGNLSGSLLASIILVFYPHDTVAIWIGSAILGMSYASIYPTVMTWMSENTQVSGISTAVLVSGGMIGDISLPAVFGVLVAHLTPDILIHGTLVGIVISSILIAVLFIVAYVYKKRKGLAGSVRYNRLDQDNLTNGDVIDLDNEKTPQCVSENLPDDSLCKDKATEFTETNVDSMSQT